MGYGFLKTNRQIVYLNKETFFPDKKSKRNHHESRPSTLKKNPPPYPEYE